jgi:hypothetical protein
LESHEVYDINSGSCEKYFECKIPVVKLRKKEYVAVPQNENNQVEFLGSVAET